MSATTCTAATRPGSSPRSVRSSTRSEPTMASLPHQRHDIFQVSVMSALLDGVYDGEMTIGELLSHGDFGLGTVDALDGELLVLDGQAHQLHTDGGAQRA